MPFLTEGIIFMMDSKILKNRLHLVCIFLITLSVFSIFLPLMTFHMPQRNPLTLSAFDIMLSAMESPRISPQDKALSSTTFGLSDIRAIAKNSPKQYTAIMAGLDSGIAAHILLIFILRGVFRRAYQGVFIYSLFASLAITFNFLTIFLLNGIIHTIFKSNLQSVVGIPYAQLEIFTKPVEVLPGMAVYGLMATTLLLAIISFGLKEIELLQKDKL